MEKEKAFWEYWRKWWPYASLDEKTLQLSANYIETRKAFFAGYERITTD